MVVDGFIFKNNQTALSPVSLSYVKQVCDYLKQGLFTLNEARNLREGKFGGGGHSIAPKTTRANAASASP